jgi:menaquinone-9 beta-reductase
MHIRPGRYIGIAPLPGGLANVCVVRPAAGGDAALKDPRSALLDALAAEPMLRERFADARLIVDPLVLGPLAVDTRRHAALPHGLLLAGDAAGFIDPMTGDGLRFAMRGGELAAHAALRVLEHGWNGVHADLQEVRRREFGSKWRFNRMLRTMVGSTLGVRGATIGGRVAPGAVRAIIRYASDCGLAAAC